MTSAVLAGRQLSQLELDVLTACLHHRLLTSAQMRALLAPTTSPRWMQMTTSQLHRGGLLGRVAARDSHRVSRRLVWYITDAGRAIAQPLVPYRHHTMTADRAANALQRHTLTGNDVGIAFARHAERLGHYCGPYDWDHEVGHRYGAGNRARTVVPDLVVRTWLRAPDGDTLLTRFVEIDRGRYSPTVLRNKLRGYAELLTHTPPAQPGGPPPRPAWTRAYPAFPKVLIVFADQSPTVVDRRIDVLAELCRLDPLVSRHLRTLGLGSAPLQQVIEDGPYGPIWRTPLVGHPVDLLGEEGQVAERTGT